jgi:hypothetical protein
MDNSQDLLRKGFHLAHFIVPERATAIRIVCDATSKLEIHRDQEKKRMYWRHKYLKRKITRVIRQDSDMLQWLVYFEAEKHEKQHEQARLSTMHDLVIRYIKHLAQITTPLSSFYVNIGFQRLLHNYSTAETRNVYERVTNHFPGNEEYRKVKSALMKRLQDRFGNMLHRCQSAHGELKFEAYDGQESLAGLVDRCLSEFTPWSTSQACCLSDPLDRIYDPKNGDLSNKRGKGNLDSLETYRSHIFIHPPCFAKLSQQLGLDPSYQRLNVPRFNMNANDDLRGKPADSREPAHDLTDQERQTIAERLNREAIQRQQIHPERVRVLVDGREVALMELSRGSQMQRELQEAARLIEVWAAGDEEILLATHWIDYAELHQPVKAEATINLGAANQLCLKIIPRDHSAQLLLDLRRRSGWVWKGHSPLSDWGQAWPKYALSASAALLLASLTANLAYHNQTIKQRATIESTSRELAQERASHPQQLSNSASQSTVSFRLSVDGIKPRDAQGQDVPRLTIPSQADLVSFDLAVNTTGAERCRAKLKLFLGNKNIVEEDQLKPISVGNNGSHVTFRVPAALLAPDKYYVATLEAFDNTGKLVKSNGFTFYIAGKK